MKPEPATTQASEATVRAYHQRTKHNFIAYAQGPGTLDWDAQPAPFRHFELAPSIQLPNFSESLQDPALLAALTRPFATLADTIQPLPYSLSTLGALLHLALGITAWKSYGLDRWAVRANPSSGNLHPIEAYIVAQGLQGLPDGVYHYCPDSHKLERRADIACAADSTPILQIGLSSIMWREAWKYGERAFRYCQLDTGHAVGALSYAAQTLGWSLTEQKQINTEALATLLGVDRSTDFPARRHPETEREEAEILLSISFNHTVTIANPINNDSHVSVFCRSDAPSRSDGANRDGASLLQKLACVYHDLIFGINYSNSQPITPNNWQGTASTIDAHPIYRWPVIEEVAIASRQTIAKTNQATVLPTSKTNVTTSNPISTASVILGRRSAQRFNASHVMPAQDFIHMLEALLPNNSAPWNALSSGPSINLLLFVHRVAGFNSGLYLLTREPRLAAQLDSHLSQQFLREPVANIPAHLNLQFLTPAPVSELHRVARSLHCHQDIAANACFALGMLAEYNDVITDNPSAYRDLHREAGLIGQVLYLQAEMIGLRGTGIGCFFDDPIHELFGMTDDTFQTLYHFTVGLALDDTRIENIPTSTLTTTQARTS